MSRLRVNSAYPLGSESQKEIVLGSITTRMYQRMKKPIRYDTMETEIRPQDLELIESTTLPIQSLSDRACWCM